MATAKGIALALGVPLAGISTLDAIAWKAWQDGARGRLLVVGDAMRKEVYPAFFQLDAAGVQRLTEDRVIKAAAFAESVPREGASITGDALFKYLDLFACEGSALPEEAWTPTGSGLLLALEHALHEEGASVLKAPGEVPALRCGGERTGAARPHRCARSEERRAVPGCGRGGHPSF